MGGYRNIYGKDQQSFYFDNVHMKRFKIVFSFDIEIEFVLGKAQHIN